MLFANVCSNWTLFGGVCSVYSSGYQPVRRVKILWHGNVNNKVDYVELNILLRKTINFLIFLN
jgi:hypothetical protein